jgi:hypothetical protein
LAIYPAVEASEIPANGPIYWAEISDTLASNVAQHHVSQAGALRTSVLPKVSIRKTNDLIADTMGGKLPWKTWRKRMAIADCTFCAPSRRHSG